MCFPYLTLFRSRCSRRSGILSECLPPCPVAICHRSLRLPHQGLSHKDPRFATAVAKLLPFGPPCKPAAPKAPRQDSQDPVTRWICARLKNVNFCWKMLRKADRVFSRNHLKWNFYFPPNHLSPGGNHIRTKCRAIVAICRHKTVLSLLMTCFSLQKI